MLAFSYTKSQFVSINVDKESVTSFTSPLHQNTYGSVRLSYKQWGYPLMLHSPGPSSLKQHVFSDATAHMIIMPTSTALYSVLPGVLGSRDTKARTERVPHSFGMQFVLLRETRIQRSGSDLRNG